MLKYSRCGQGNIAEAILRLYAVRKLLVVDELTHAVVVVVRLQLPRLAHVVRQTACSEAKATD